MAMLSIAKPKMSNLRRLFLSVSGTKVEMTKKASAPTGTLM